MTSTTQRPQIGIIASRAEWREALDSLPDREQLQGSIPSFYFAHGSPSLIWPKGLPNPIAGLLDSKINAPDGLLHQFLEDFGKTLIEKYQPRGIVVFSAHWDDPELLVTDYGSENPLLYDYYGMPEPLYDVTYRSRGDSGLSRLVVDTFEDANMQARITTISEIRGRDGRRTNKPDVAAGLDHGVFIPFMRMFPDTAGAFPIPIVEVSMSQDFTPEPQWELGAALKALRSQGILILSGGLTVHDFGDFSSFNENLAKPIYHDWNDKIVKTITTEGSLAERKKALVSLVEQPEYKVAHRPRDDHFIPIYIAAGAGEDGNSKLLTGMFGATTVAFGL